MKIRQKIREVNELYKGVIGQSDIVFGIAALLFCFFTMYYADITVTCQFGITFIDSLFDGKILSFYANALSAGIAPEGAVYDIGTYVIFGIWGFPVWALNKITGFSVLSVGSLLWFKLLLVLFLAGTVRIVRKISGQLGLDSNQSAIAAVIFLLSSTVVIPVFCVAQYDIIALFFLMRGIYSFNDGRERSFLFWTAISMTIKPLTILILVLLIVLKKKNVFFIVSDMVKGSSLMLLCKGIYSLSPAYRESCSGFLEKNLVNMFDTRIGGSYSEISVFIMGLMVVYIYAYFQDAEENGKVLIKKAIILGFCVWGLFCAFGTMTAYWTIYMAPFAVIITFFNKKNVNRMLLLDAVMNIMLTLLLVMKYTWVYGGDRTFSYLILKGFCRTVLNGIQGTTVAGIMRRFLNGSWCFTAIAGVMVACMMMMVYYAWQGIRMQSDADEKSEKINVWHIRGRIALCYLWISANAGALFLTVTGH